MYRITKLDGTGRGAPILTTPLLSLSLLLVLAVDLGGCQLLNWKECPALYNLALWKYNSGLQLECEGQS